MRVPMVNEWMDGGDKGILCGAPFLFGFVCAQKWMKDISMITFHRATLTKIYMNLIGPVDR